MPDPVTAPRLRLAASIDLTKADPTCENCGGTGHAGKRTVPTADGDLTVSVVCRCVTRNGGVARDKLDEILEQIGADLASGAFGPNLARDVCALPGEARARAVANLYIQARDPKTPPDVAKAVRRAISIIGEFADGGTHGIPSPAHS